MAWTPIGQGVEGLPQTGPADQTVSRAVASRAIAVQYVDPIPTPLVLAGWRKVFECHAASAARVTVAVPDRQYGNRADAGGV
jgi:hypothetical protein